MPKPVTIATHEAIRANTVALTEAANAPGRGLAAVRVIKPLRSIVFGAIQASWDVAPAPSAKDWTASQRAAEPFVCSAIDLVEETMRRAAKAAVLEGQDPAEVVREIEKTLKSVLTYCANRHAGGGQ